MLGEMTSKKNDLYSVKLQAMKPDNFIWSVYNVVHGTREVNLDAKFDMVLKTKKCMFTYHQKHILSYI